MSKIVPIEIVDIIDHRNAYGVQVFLVVNRMPSMLFERSGMWLLGRDGFVRQSYKLDRVAGPSHWQAFGGRTFDIPMADGSVEKADGQWWDYTYPDWSGEVCAPGISTAGRLEECYVFMGGFRVDQSAIDEWRSSNVPSNNYHKYDCRKSGWRHKDFGKHKIVSRWHGTHGKC